MHEYNSLDNENGRLRSDASLDIQIKDAKQRAEEFSKFLKETNFEQGTNNFRKEHEDAIVTNDYNQLIHHYNSNFSSNPPLIPHSQNLIQNNGTFGYENHKPTIDNNIYQKSVNAIENHPKNYKSVELNQNDDKIEHHSNNNVELIKDYQKLRKLVSILNKEKAQLQFEILSLNKLLKETESRQLHQISQTQQQQESQHKLIQTLKNNYSNAVQETAKLKSDYNAMKKKLDTISSRNLFLEKLLESKHLISPDAEAEAEADADTTSSSSGSSSHSSYMNNRFLSSSRQLPSEYHATSTSFFPSSKPPSSEETSPNSESLHTLSYIINNSKNNNSNTINGNNGISRNPQITADGEELTNNIESSKTIKYPYSHSPHPMNSNNNSNNNNAAVALTMRPPSASRTTTGNTTNTITSTKDKPQPYLGDKSQPYLGDKSQPYLGDKFQVSSSNNSLHNPNLVIDEGNELRRGNFFDDSDDDPYSQMDDGSRGSNRHRDSGLAAWERRLIRKGKKSQAARDSSDSDSEASGIANGNGNGNIVEEKNTDYFHDNSQYYQKQDRLISVHSRYPPPSASSASANTSIPHPSKQQLKDTSNHTYTTTETEDSYHHPSRLPNLSMSSEQLRELLAEMRALQNHRDQGARERDTDPSTTANSNNSHSNNNNNNNNNNSISKRLRKDHEREGNGNGKGGLEEYRGASHYINTTGSTGTTSEFSGSQSRQRDRLARDASTSRWNDLLLPSSSTPTPTPTPLSGEREAGGYGREGRGGGSVPHHLKGGQSQSQTAVSGQRTETPKRRIQVCLPRSATEAAHSDRSCNSINMSPATNPPSKPMKSVKSTAAAVAPGTHKSYASHAHSSNAKKPLVIRDNHDQYYMRTNARTMKQSHRVTKTDDTSKGRHHHLPQDSLKPEKLSAKGKTGATEIFNNRQATQAYIKHDNNSIQKVTNHNQTTKLRSKSVSSAARENTKAYSNSSILLEHSRSASSLRHPRPSSASSLPGGRDRGRVRGTKQQAQPEEQSRIYGLSRSKSTDAIANNNKKKR